MPLSLLHYDVFTGEPLAGNQLAVFPDARGLTADRMQALACEMNFSESTFILPPETPGTDARMRIFTPAAEMPMAGHPTIGSTFALAHAGVISPGASRFVFGLGVGPVPVDLEWEGGRLRFAWMTQLNPTFGPALDARDGVAASIGLGAADLVGNLPVQQVSCGVPFLIVPIGSREAVDRALSDASAFRRLATSTGIDLPIFLFALSPPGSSDTVYSRMFAPEFGIIEDRHRQCPPPAVPAGRLAAISSATASSRATPRSASSACRAWRWVVPAASTSQSKSAPAKSWRSRLGARRCSSAAASCWSERSRCPRIAARGWRQDPGHETPLCLVAFAWPSDGLSRENSLLDGDNNIGAPEGPHSAAIRPRRTLSNGKDYSREPGGC